jgi:hypothetical protein
MCQRPMEARWRDLKTYMHLNMYNQSVVAGVANVLSASESVIQASTLYLSIPTNPEVIVASYKYRS